MLDWTQGSSLSLRLQPQPVEQGPESGLRPERIEIWIAQPRGHQRAILQGLVPLVLLLTTSEAGAIGRVAGPFTARRFPPIRPARVTEARADALTAHEDVFAWDAAMSPMGEDPLQDRLPHHRRCVVREHHVGVPVEKRAHRWVQHQCAHVRACHALQHVQ